MAVSFNMGQFRRHSANAEPQMLSKLETMNIETVNQEVITEVRSSLEKVLNLLDNSSHHTDEGMIAIGLSENLFVEPLNRHEVMVLASLLWVEKSRGRGGIYNDVLALTRHINGKAMNLTMVYKTIERLIDREMIVEASVPEGVLGRSRAYRANEHGRQAFRMAILNAEALKRNPDSAAA